MNKNKVVKSIIEQDSQHYVKAIPNQEESLQEIMPDFRLYGKSNIPAKSPYNVKLALELQPSTKEGLKYNEFTNTIEITGNAVGNDHRRLD